MLPDLQGKDVYLMCVSWFWSTHRRHLHLRWIWRTTWTL